MKTYNYTKINSTPNNSINFSSNTSTNYSKILDDLIYADIADKNKYLFTGGTTKNTSDIYLDKIIDSCNTKTYTLNGAIKFITNGKTYKNNFPYKIGETYYTEDGTPIIFFEDSIQIGFDLYYFYELNAPIFIKNITPKTKKHILDIYADGLKISILK